MVMKTETMQVLQDVIKKAPLRCRSAANGQ